MSKKSKNKYENDFYEYEDESDFSVYDRDLEESVMESRRARREAKKNRKVKKASKVQNANSENLSEQVGELAAAAAVPNDNIKIKSKRKKSNKNGKKVKVASAQAGTADNVRPKKKKKKGGIIHFLFCVASVFICLYALAVIGVIAYSYLDNDPETDWINSPTTPIDTVNNTAADIVVPEVPDRTIVLLMITDEDKTRTDSMVLANYDNVNKRLSLVSIPRDIMVEVTDEDYEIMRSEYPEPGSQVMKMNHIHHFGGEKHGVELLLNEIEHLFDVKPDYYVKIDFDGFNYIIDSIGGVEFDVPQDMDYEDPTQDLYIHLKKGVQVLNGDQAQQLVRFRKDNYGGGYVNGDIDRLKVQQAFMKAFMSKALKSDTIFKNLLNYMNAFNKYVTTNAKINDMVRYASVVKSINMDNVITYTLPCEPSPEYGEYIVEEDEAQRLIYDVFKKPLDQVAVDLQVEAAEANLEKSTDKKIKILNGGYTEGMAREIMARFNTKDIQVAEVGTYNDAHPDGTTIYTSREGIGLDLVKFFYNGAEVKVDPEMTGDFDIVVIVGVNEPLEKGGEAVTSEYENYEPEVIDDTEGNDSDEDDGEYYYDDENDDYDYDTGYDDDYYDDYDDDYDDDDYDEDEDY